MNNTPTICGLTLDRVAEIDSLITSLRYKANAALVAVASAGILSSEAKELAYTSSRQTEDYEGVAVHTSKENQLIEVIALEWLCLKILIRSEHGQEAVSDYEAKLSGMLDPLYSYEMDEAMLSFMGSAKSDLAECYIRDNGKKHLKIFVDAKFSADLGL